MKTRKVNEYSVYISGAITGNENAEESFRLAEEKLRKLFPKAEVYNPLEKAKELTKSFNFGKPKWSDYMKYVLQLLMKSDCAYFLKGWTNSKGALLEHALCEQLDIKIVEEE